MKKSSSLPDDWSLKKASMCSCMRYRISSGCVRTYTRSLPARGPSKVIWSIWRIIWALHIAVAFVGHVDAERGTSCSRFRRRCVSRAATSLSASSHWRRWHRVCLSLREGWADSRKSFRTEKTACWCIRRCRSPFGRFAYAAGRPQSGASHGRSGCGKGTSQILVGIRC